LYVEAEDGWVDIVEHSPASAHHVCILKYSAIDNEAKEYSSTTFFTSPYLCLFDSSTA